jgi:adenylate cyclase
VLPLPDKPSIAVLPFANMSGDPEREYYRGDHRGDVAHPLALFAIARNSSFTYKGALLHESAAGRSQPPASTFI